MAGDDDVAVIAWLCSAWTGGDPRDPELAEWMAAWLADEGQRRTTWLAFAGELPIGMVGLAEYRRMPRPGRRDSRWGYVSGMFVLEEFRGRGAGAALLAALITAADERSYARVVVSPSDEAISFYRRAGFVLPGSAPGAEALLVRPAAAV
jgi:GNAT superfamily N-acetyltransferase